MLAKRFRGFLEFFLLVMGKGEIMKNKITPYAIASILYLVLGCPLSGCAESITPDQIQSHFKSIKPWEDAV